MIVADASVLLELLLRTPAGRELEDRLLDPDETLHAPHLVDVEVAQVTRRYGRCGELAEARGRQLLVDLDQLPLERYGHRPLLPHMLGAARERDGLRRGLPGARRGAGRAAPHPGPGPGVGAGLWRAGGGGVGRAARAPPPIEPADRRRKGWSMRTDDNRVSVGVGAILVSQGEVLLMRRAQPHGQGTWSTPGGYLEPGESFEACARREARAR